MDIRFLQSISEGFVVDRELTGKIKSEKIADYLLESLRELREEDQEVYDELYQKPKRYQKEVLECMLEYEICGISSIEQSLIEGLKSIIENDDLLIESGESEEVIAILEDVKDVLKGSYDKMKEIKEKILDKPLGGRIFKLIWDTGALLTAGTATWLFPLWIVTPIILLMTGLIVFSNSGSQILFKSVENLGGLLLSLAKWMKSAGTSFRYRYVMAFKNDEECYAKMGLDANSVRALVPWLFKSKTKLLSNFAPAISVAQATRLRECFMNGMVTKITLFLEFYFDCIKKTGGWHEIMNAGEDKLMKIIAGGGMSPACDEYHRNAKEFLDIFEELLKTFYVNDPEQASNWRKALYSDIMNTRKIVDRKQKETYRKWSDEGSGPASEIRSKAVYNQQKDYKRKY